MPLAIMATMNCGTDTTVIAMMASGHSDADPPPSTIATDWPKAMLSAQRQARCGNQ